MGEFEGMQHLQIEFKDGGHSSVQEEIRNIRMKQRDFMDQLAISDQPAVKKEVKAAEAYRINAHLERAPVVKEE